MSAAQLVREPCRHILLQSRPTTCNAIHSVTACPYSARRTFSQSRTFRADDEDEGAGAGRVRQAKTPTRLRRRMYAWLNGPGRAFVNPLPGSTNYLSAYDSKGRLRRSRINKGGSQDGGADEGGDTQRSGGLPAARDHEQRPYPLNENFTSQAVLSEELKDAIYKKVVVDGQSVSAVSAHFHVDMRRVAAVVRLKEVEKNWEKEGKTLANDYATAVLDMLPQTQLDERSPKMHESINDLPVHPATKQQIFYPTSESREFTRQDAAKVFSPSLLPADDRVPHPELIRAMKGANSTLSRAAQGELANKMREAVAKTKTVVEANREAAETARTTVVKGSRWNFRFESIDAGLAGKDGRGPAGVGWRYGMPFEDRKRGNLKGVPTKVEV